MFKSNLKIAWRNLVKDRQFTFLNLAGLSTGLACALFIWLWISDEVQVDKFHIKDNQLYQVMQLSKEPQGALSVGELTPGPLAKALPKDMPDVEYAVGVFAPGKKTGVLSAGDKQVRANEEYAGKDFFKVFSYPIIDGDKNNLLTDKYSVWISDELAGKLFSGTKNIVGKTVSWKNETYSGSYQVAGVFKNPPKNSTAQFDLLFSFDLYLERGQNANDWGNNDPSTYVVLKNGINVSRFNKKIENYIQSKTGKTDMSLFLRRYSDKYLYSKYENGVQVGGRIEYVRLFSFTAIFILAIACINFMNLATARASKRTKEVGIKKVVGARRGSLIFQYMTESMLTTLLSMVIAIVGVLLLLPAFNEITGKTLRLNINTSLILYALGITFITGFLSGTYPAFYMSGFNPLMVLKGKLRTTIGELWVRQGLVVFQFTISVILIVAVLVVYQQVTFIRSKNLGFNKDNIIVLKKDGQLNKSIEPFLQEVRNKPGVVDATVFAGNLISNPSGTGDVAWDGKASDRNVTFKCIFVGKRFIETLGIAVIEGRSFSTDAGADSTQIIFNEAAIDAMGLKDPIGKTVVQWGQRKKIVGITKDFHLESLYEKVKPCFFILAPQADFVDNIMVKIKAGTEKSTIAGLQKAYQAYNPGYPFEYKFLDQDFQTKYESENRVQVLSGYFAGIAILISCLGLFGLAGFTAQRRQKEIGIRKVVGASVSGLILMLSRDFMKLVLIAVIIAFPIAWWAMNQWLNSFAYRVRIGSGVFILAAGAILFMTLLTVGFQTIRAAMGAPVKSLRTE
jgi:putative ABC transport system permease protein